MPKLSAVRGVNARGTPGDTELASPGDSRSDGRLRAFAQGALVITLDDLAFAPIATVRERCDPEMAALIGPHLTLTPPFLRSPDAGDLQDLRRVAARHVPFTLVIDGVSRFAGTDVVFLGAGPADRLEHLREDLLATGLFEAAPRTASAFVPHVTLSESPGGSDLAERLGGSITRVESVCRQVVWVAPMAAGRFGPLAVLR
jgi:2'-5' RNA ligase